MARDYRGIGINKLLDKITPQEDKLIQSTRSLLYNVVGFISVSDFVDNGTIISNIGYLIAEKNINTCILDFKVFAPTLYNYLDVEANEKGKGLLSVLKDDKIDIREHINQTKYKQLYLLSPSPYDLIEEYLDFEFEHIERVINELKEVFDLVLIDIPNNPPLEFCLAAMKYVHRGFMTVGERMESIGNMIKLIEFIDSVGITPSKFTNVIFSNTLDINYDYGALKETNLKLIARLPLVQSSISEYFKGNLYLKDSTVVNKQFLVGIQNIMDVILS